MCTYSPASNPLVPRCGIVPKVFWETYKKHVPLPLPFQSIFYSQEGDTSIHAQIYINVYVCTCETVQKDNQNSLFFTAHIDWT